MIPADMMAGAQAFQSKRLRDLASIHRPTIVEDDLGGTTETWVPIVESIACGVAIGRSNDQGLEGRLADRIGSNPFFVVLLPHHTDIRLTDRIIQLAPVARHFEVLAIENRDTTYETLRRVVVVVHGQI